MPWSRTDITCYQIQLGLPDKGRVIKDLVDCNDWDLEPLDLLNGINRIKKDLFYEYFAHLSL